MGGNVSGFDLNPFTGQIEAKPALEKVFKPYTHFDCGQFVNFNFDWFNKIDCGDMVEINPVCAKRNIDLGVIE